MKSPSNDFGRKFKKPIRAGFGKQASETADTALLFGLKTALLFRGGHIVFRGSFKTEKYRTGFASCTNATILRALIRAICFSELKRKTTQT
jgi:hypothetical protein